VGDGIVIEWRFDQSKLAGGLAINSRQGREKLTDGLEREQKL
jgi:hypothetical protein